MADSLTQLSAVALTERLRRGEISAVEALDAHILRIEAVNAKLNALVLRRYDVARIEARQADERRAAGQPLGALHGLPVTIKDSLDVTGMPSTYGLKTRKDHRADVDELHVARLRAAGAIVIGKTNVSQCLAFTEADNPVYGRTVNPWNNERTPGGSSGGEGAIIAVGGSPMGLGSDIGGSVRVPAAFCGIASLKPTSGRMDDMGDGSWPPGQRAVPSQVGVMARSAADVALGYGIARGAQREEPPAVSIENLRVAYYTDDGSFAPAPAVKRAVLQAAEALRAAGARVFEWPPHAVPEANRIFGALLTADGAAYLRGLLVGSPVTPQLKQLLLGAGIPGWLRPALVKLLRAAGQNGMADNLGVFGDASAHRYFSNVDRQRKYQHDFAAQLDEADGGYCDLILAPPCSLPAFTHGATRDLTTAGAYATLYNFLGWPAGVVPVTRVRAGEESGRVKSNDLLQKLASKVEADSAGLPIGVQVIARPWQEHVALAAMQAIETAARTQPDFPATPVDPR